MVTRPRVTLYRTYTACPFKTVLVNSQHDCFRKRICLTFMSHCRQYFEMWYGGGYKRGDITSEIVFGVYHVPYHRRLVAGFSLREPGRVRSRGSPRGIGICDAQSGIGAFPTTTTSSCHHSVTAPYPLICHRGLVK